MIFNGTTERLHIPAAAMHTTEDFIVSYDGLAKYINQMADSEMTAASQKWAEQFSRTAVCPECHGKRLNREALSYRLDGRSIADFAEMDISELYTCLSDLEARLDKQRAAIARALITRPAVVLADEPTGNLDHQNSVEVFRLLREAAAQQHQTVVYVTHDQGLAAQADRVLRMQDGRIEEA